MKRAALYLRVSTDEQAMHGYSIDAQREALTKFANENNYYIVDYYVDEGYSARKNYKKRKEFLRMMADVESNKIDIILFIKLDRWFRSIRDYYEIQTILDRHNVAWKAIFEQYDTATASGRLHVNIMLSVAQDEADRTSERIKLIFAEKIRRGEAITGNLPFGLMIKDKKVVPDPEKAHIIKEMFDHYQTYQSKQAVIPYLAEKHGTFFRRHVVTSMLRNPLYKGQYRDVTDYCDPIIKPEQFDAIQAITKRNIKQTGTRSIYIFTGLLRCPLCGYIYSSAKTKTSENVYNYHYRCNNHYQQKVCTNNKTLGEKPLERYLLDNIEAEVKRCIRNYESNHSIPAPNPVKQEREKLLRKMDKLKDLYLNDLINKEAYKSDYEIFSRQLAELQEPPEEDVVDVAGLRNFLTLNVRKIYATLSREERRALWRGIIKEIRFTKAFKPVIYFR